MEDMTELRSLAQKCRRLADAISEGPARDNLIGLAAEYEHRAGEVAAREDEPLFQWQARVAD